MCCMSYVVYPYQEIIVYWLGISFREILDDQTQGDSKPAGQPEHASLNQCQLIAAKRPKLVLLAPPAGGGDTVSQ